MLILTFAKKLLIYISIITTTCAIPTYILTENDAQHDIAQICDCDFCNDIHANTLMQTRKGKSISSNKKNWTVIIYIAADNDLRSFAARNIKQMMAIGSNEHLNILVHLDIRISGGKKITRRYYIEKDRILHVNPYDDLSQQMDSGNPATLISCCEWGITNYPADEYALILWNHGTGILEPRQGKIFRPADLFSFNPATNRFDVNRSISFIDFISDLAPDQRGICWDDSTGNFLSNQQLESTLQIICNNYLKGKKFSIIGFDACLMSMIEVASFVKNYAHIMVSSQEVELGIGWNYSAVLSPFANATLDKVSFAQHIVNAYHYTFNSITYDYTLSAINLDSIMLLEKNINSVANLLIEALRNQRASSVSQAIRASRNKLLCTHFDEPSYIDIHHLYSNIAANLKNFKLFDAQHEMTLKNTLNTLIHEGQSLIEEFVLANTAGRNLKNAHGLSIYFPERIMHSSYKEATFVTTNKWNEFLLRYLF